MDRKINDLKILSVTALQELCEDIRGFLIESNSRTGGHIGANLGVVELSIALHRVFDSPTDGFVFDTGHIGYTHKLLTGRKGLFATLNSFGGMNRFITPHESEHDLVEMSHAGTSLSIGLGLALSKKFKNDPSFTISVIGDGSLAEGVALEALNHISTTEVNQLILINDNGYAISPGCGAIHQHLANLKDSDVEIDNLFTSLGYEYDGPLDGHDVKLLIEKFNEYKMNGGIKVIHIKTEKGRGYAPAKNSPIKMHFSNPFNVRTGEQLDRPTARQVSTFATEAMIEAMKSDDSILAMTAGTKYATDLDRLHSEFPKRTLDPGMSEQHLISMAVGTTLNGHYPVLNYQSTFLQRGYDQLMHDVAFTNKPLMILASRSGFAGYDNPTHHGIYDLSYLKALPNFRIVYPANCGRLREIVSSELAKKSGPLIVCYPYGFETEYCFNPNLEPKTAETLILTTGNLASEYQEFRITNSIQRVRISALEELSPLDEVKVLDQLQRHDRVVIVEEAVKRGGLGESIAALILENNINCEFITIALENKFYPGGTSQELRDYADISAPKVFRSIGH